MRTLVVPALWLLQALLVAPPAPGQPVPPGPSSPPRLAPSGQHPLPLQSGAPRTPLAWGNALYVDLAVGQSHSFLGRTVTLLSITANYARVAVDGEQRELIVARRALPEVVNGVRIFIADNRHVADATTDVAFPDVHGLLTRDALLVLSDPAKPLLDRARYTFPIDRSDGYRWTMEEDSHMFAYLGERRSHEGIDLNMHEARGRQLHALVAIESGTIRWIETSETAPNEACILLQSESQPGIYYVYQHLNENQLLVSPGQKVSKGQKLGYVWGDGAWGHLHFAVPAFGPAPAAFSQRYQHLLNTFPALYELWHGDLEPRPVRRAAGHFSFDRVRFSNGNTTHLGAFDDVVGYGWRLGRRSPAGKVEESVPDGGWGSNARLRRTLFAGTPAEATSADDHYLFEIAIPQGPRRVQVRVSVGDHNHATWQRVSFEGVPAGEYRLEANRFAWTPAVRVPVEDGKLTVRIDVDGHLPAGISELVFHVVQD